MSSTLPASALLGWDIPELLAFVADRNVKNSADALAVMTRLRRRQQQEALDREPLDQEVEASAKEMETLPEAPQDEPERAPRNDGKTPSSLRRYGYTFGFNFDDSVFSPAGPSRQTLTRAEKRENRRRYRHANVGYGSDVPPEELRRLQDADESLSRPRSIADGAPSAAAGENFFRRDGLLYRRYSPPGADSDAHDIEQLVLPTELRPTVLKLAHDVPMAGHLGKKKTTDRILNRFYWPGLFRDVEEHCRSCGQCQKLSTRKVKKAPLVPLPIMDEPFRRIAMDIVGPLPRSSSGKRYILVICDYATRYPEAVVLRT